MAVAVGFEPTEACTSHAFEFYAAVSMRVCGYVNAIPEPDRGRWQVPADVDK